MKNVRPTSGRKQVLQKNHEKITNDTIFSRVDTKEAILQKAIRGKMSLFAHVTSKSDDKLYNDPSEVDEE